METISSTNLQSLLPVLTDIDFFIIGEMHGIQENALIIKEVLNVALKTQRKVILALEWPLTNAETTAIQKYINGGSAIKKIPSFFTTLMEGLHPNI